jgi:hypothetical protein
MREDFNSKAAAIAMTEIAMGIGIVMVVIAETQARAVMEATVEAATALILRGRTAFRMESMMVRGTGAAVTAIGQRRIATTSTLTTVTTQVSEIKIITSSLTARLTRMDINRATTVAAAGAGTKSTGSGKAMQRCMAFLFVIS